MEQQMDNKPFFMQKKYEVIFDNHLKLTEKIVKRRHKVQMYKTGISIKN